MARIYPSLIDADPCNLQSVIEELDPHVDGFHIDVMDNHFVPNLAFGPHTVNRIAKIAKNPLWIHLMVDNPMDWDSLLFLPHGSLVSFHFEAEVEIPRFIKQLKEKNYKASLVINPKTPVEEIFPILNALDQILIMSVEPGFSGQPFFKESIDKCDKIAAYRQTSNLDFRIGMDGSIGLENIGILKEKGTDDFAIAAAIFRKPDHIAALQELNKLAQ